MLRQVPRPALGKGFIGIMEKKMETKDLGFRAIFGGVIGIMKNGNYYRHCNGVFVGIMVVS